MAASILSRVEGSVVSYSVGGQVGSLEQVLERWSTAIPRAEIIPISALDGTNVEVLLEKIKGHLPRGPPMYPNDTLTDKSERFLASEIIRCESGVVIIGAGGSMDLEVLVPGATLVEHG
jgi:GTPase Era involved in 16S rRNA processing